MKVEIWSDVMCPFCYIGKRRFEKALAKFEHNHQVEIIWKSFLLMPDLKTDPSKNVVEFLAKTKGWTLDYARNAHEYVTNMAKEEDLHYNFERAVVANSFNAHRLLHLAKRHAKGHILKESLLKAYFIEGKNIDERETLISMGKNVGLPTEDMHTMFESDLFADEVRKDLYEARQVGVTGVPFFLFDGKYAVSGAQSVDVFISALRKIYEEQEATEQTTAINPNENAACTTDGDCS
ncbi:MAG: DsbA family protein [Cyclobacteriaceae bacterium]